MSKRGLIFVLISLLLFLNLLSINSFAGECDNWETAHPDWLVCEDFESFSTYDDENVNDNSDFESWEDDSVWYSSEADDSGRIQISKNDKLGGDYSLYMPGAEESGYLGAALRWTDCESEKTRPCDKKGHEELYLRAHIKFAPDHHFIHHFMNLGGSQKDSYYYWPSMGTAGCTPDGFLNAGTTVDVNKDTYDTFFYTYSMDMRCGSPAQCRGVSYATKICNDCENDHFLPCPSGVLQCCWGNHYERDEDAILPKEEWFCLEMKMKLDTAAVDVKDGEMAYWINDELIHEENNMYWRINENLQLNKAGLQHYISADDVKDYNLGSNKIWWDNVVVSKERIGCYQPCENEDVLCVDDTSGDNQEYDNIQEALDDATAGDTVLIHSGTYYPSSRLEIKASGTINNPITIRGIGNPIIDGNGNINDVLNVEFYDNIIIEDLEIINANRAGIRLTHSDNSIVRNNNVHDNSQWQIFTSFCDDILIEGNECYGSTIEHGIYFSNSADNPIIRNNIIHDNYGNGLHMNGDIESGSDIYHDVDGIISNALVENNIIYSNGANGGSAINCDGVQDSIIRNNLVYDQHSSGISLYQDNGGEISINNEVFHNTIVIADDGKWPLNMKDGSSANTVYNNIFLTQHPSYGSIALEGISGIDINYNILTTNEDVVTPDNDASFMTLSEWQTQGHDLNSYAAEITDIFIDFPNDFRLKNSVAVDAGFDVGVNNDILNNVRPYGNGYDIGAYESGHNNDPPPPEQCTDADEDEDGEISNGEMDDYIVLWLGGDVDLSDLFDAIEKWKNDCEI
jgi:parallel beta-helix repeat protein